MMTTGAYLTRPAITLSSNPLWCFDFKYTVQTHGSLSLYPLYHIHIVLAHDGGIFGRFLNPNASSLLFFLLLVCCYSGGMMKLSEESLTRPPEEVFDILGKLGEG